MVRATAVPARGPGGRRPRPAPGGLPRAGGPATAARAAVVRRGTAGYRVPRRTGGQPGRTRGPGAPPGCPPIPQGPAAAGQAAAGRGGSARGGSLRGDAVRGFAAWGGAARDRAARDRAPGPGRSQARGAPRRGTLTRGSPSRRLRITMLCIGFVLSLIAGRLVQLQAMEGSIYRAKADSWRLTTIPVPAVRGSITSADGTTLAMTVQTDLVHADPPLITQARKSFSAVASALAGPLGMSAAAILAKLENPTSNDYVMLKKSVPATTAAAITALNQPGIAMAPSYTREYPNGDLAANLIGFTNTNGAGVLTGEAGIEQADNSLLTGRAGQQEVQVGTNDQPIPVAGQTTRQMVAGDNVRLTILASLQWEAEQACAQEVKKTDASNCTVVIMQPSTGKILVMAQSPSFNPAHPASVASTTDMPVANVFDPGSTAKVITAAAAMEHGGQTPMSAYTVPESIVQDGFSFHDAEYHPTERWTIAGIIAHSSNVGMVQVAQHVSPKTQYRYFRNFGIGQPSVPGLPAQSNGILYPTSKWWGDERYTLSFGQGVAVTAVQMASVYATIANGGVRVTPSVVAGATGPAAGSCLPRGRLPTASSRPRRPMS